MCLRDLNLDSLNKPELLSRLLLSSGFADSIDGTNFLIDRNIQKNKSINGINHQTNKNGVTILSNLVFAIL